jgi:hypothetical protein
MEREQDKNWKTCKNVEGKTNKPRKKKRKKSWKKTFKF